MNTFVPSVTDPVIRASCPSTKAGARDFTPYSDKKPVGSIRSG